MAPKPNRCRKETGWRGVRSAIAFLEGLGMGLGQLALVGALRRDSCSQPGSASVSLRAALG